MPKVHPDAAVQPESVVVAKNNAFLRWDGRDIMVRGGVTTANHGHAIVKAHPDLWRPLEITFPYHRPAAPKVVRPAAKPVEETTEVRAAPAAAAAQKPKPKPAE